MISRTNCDRNEFLTKPSRPLKTYRIKVVIVPPNVLIGLGLANIKEEIRTVQAHSLKEARQKAEIL